MALSPYYERMAPYARQASAATGVPVSVILAQWANESGHGTSDAARTANNHAGIKTDGRNRSYASIEAFVQDYIHTLNLPYYDKVRAVAKSGAPAQTVAEELGRSPWDADHYTTDSRVPGMKLTALLAAGLPALFDAGADALSALKPLTIAQIQQIEAKLGIALSEDVKRRLASSSTPVEERAQILTQTAASLGEVTPGKNAAEIIAGVLGVSSGLFGPLGPAVQVGAGIIGDTAGAVGDVATSVLGGLTGPLALLGKALGVVTSINFWRRAGIVAAGIGLAGAGLYVLIADNKKGGPTQ